MGNILMPLLAVIAGCLGAGMIGVTGLWDRIRAVAGLDRDTADPINALPDDGSRDCVLVLDASPSMQDKDWPPSRLAAAQEAARAFVDRLANEEPNARIAVVAYSQRAKIRCGLTLASNTARLLRAVDGIHVGDWTNIHAGLKAAQDLLDRTTRSAQVVLLTDGQHNTGKSPIVVADELKDDAIIECVGIGQRYDVDEALLRNIASKYADGTPRYRWIGDKEALVEHFENLAGGLRRS